MKILIDNGHGVETPGKRSPDGRFREYAYKGMTPLWSFRRMRISPWKNAADASTALPYVTGTNQTTPSW